jgi:hypothetical protein
MTEWISVNDETPTNGYTLFLICNEHQIGVGRWSMVSNRFTCLGSLSPFEAPVTHWCSLPELPK